MDVHRTDKQGKMSKAFETFLESVKQEPERAYELAKELEGKLFLTPLPQNRIHGHMFRISSPDVGEYGKRVAGYTQVNSDFKNEYSYHHAAKQSIAEAAKVFLEDNWKNVKDWTHLSICVRDNTGDKTEYFNYKDKDRGYPQTDDAFDLHDYYMERHNPVQTVSDMVLDPSDGDFSVCINDHWHLWIDDDSVIMLAEYVEGELKAQGETS